MKPVPSGSMMASCLSNSSPWKPSPSSSVSASNIEAGTLPFLPSSRESKTAVAVLASSVSDKGFAVPDTPTSSSLMLSVPLSVADAPAGAGAGAASDVGAGAAAGTDPNNGFTIEESTPLTPLVLLLLLPPKPKPKPVDDVLLPAPAPAGAGDDARAAKPPTPEPLPKTGAFDPEPNIGADFSCSVALGASNLAGGLPKVALPVDPNEKPPLVVAGAPLPPPRVLGVPNEKPPLVLVLPIVAELDVSFTDANGFLGAAVLIGGNALLEAADLAAGAGAGGFEGAENGFLGAAVLIGGNALLEAAGLAAGAGAGGFEGAENGFLGAAVLIGRNALLEAAGLAAGAGAGGFEGAENGFLGAAVLIGGNALLEAAGLAAGAGAGAGAAATGAFAVAENGFLGAAVLIGGKALLEAAGFAVAAGAAALAFAVAEKGVGALVARGGKLALEDDTAFSSFFFSALSGTLPAGAGGAPKLNPPVVELVAVDDGLAPKLKPPPDDTAVTGAGAGAGAGADVVAPPKLNPPDPIEGAAAAAVLAPPPKLKPPAPMADPLAAALSLLSSCLSSYPGRTVSQAAHLVSPALLRTMQASHFQDPSSTPNALPHPSPPDVAGLSSSSPASSSSSVSMSDSSPPNNQSRYHAMNASREIFPSAPLIFLMVRRCSSSQYVVPIDSIRSPKAAESITSTPSPTVSVKAWSAFCLSSSRSSRSAVSNEADSSSSASAAVTKLTYHETKAFLVMVPVLLGSMMASCSSFSSP